MGENSHRQDPIVLVIDFHHARGPEIELCFAGDGSNPTVDNDWSLLPFMALSDGAHTATEDFSYFSLRQNATSKQPETSLFGISCTRQIDASTLIYKPQDVTRSTVQKAVVVVTDSPAHFGMLREKLSMVTSAWFQQRDFSDTDILKKFREGLIANLQTEETHQDQYLGLSLREMIHEFKYQTLVLFKCLLLQPKMLFFGSRCERLCMIQFSLISLIPGLINNLQDCADPVFDTYSQNVEKPSSLKTSERSSLLAYMGLPLQIFGKGSMFGPYTPLQQLDLLADYGTKSYVVGSTNSLLLQQKDRYSDILINLDEGTINITSPSLRTALTLTAADRRWIDFLTQTINDTWDDAHPEQPKTHGYMGSEEFIRLQFEEYLLALLSCVNYREHNPPSGNEASPAGRRQSSQDVDGDPAAEFNSDFLTHWQSTPNYALFKRLTSDALLFSIVEPRHPCSGGLTIDDIQRRLAQQVAELHLDERVREGREALNKHLATGQKKVSTAFNNLWADFEALREAQRKRNEEARANQAERTSSDEKAPGSPASPRPSLSSVNTWFTKQKAPSVDFSQAQASVNAAGQKAGAYFSSWGSWASERRKEWQDRRTNTNPPTSGGAPTVAGLGISSSPTIRHSLSINRPVHDPQADDQSHGSVTSPRRRQSEDTASSGSRREGSGDRGEGSPSSSRAKRWSGMFRPKDRSSRSSPDALQVDTTAAGGAGASPRSPLSASTTITPTDTAPAGEENAEEGKTETEKTRPSEEEFESVPLDQSDSEKEHGHGRSPHAEPEANTTTQR